MHLCYMPPHSLDNAKRELSNDYRVNTALELMNSAETTKRLILMPSTNISTKKNVKAFQNLIEIYSKTGSERTVQLIKSIRRSFISSSFFSFHLIEIHIRIYRYKRLEDFHLDLSSQQLFLSILMDRFRKLIL